jgi:hypothetical protein
VGQRISWLALLSALFLAGCSHARIATGAIHLQDAEDYPLLVPAGSATTGDVQRTAIRLGTPPIGTDCSVRSGVFMLSMPIQSDMWTVSSPTASSWRNADVSDGMRVQWLAFAKDLAARQRQGCFSLMSHSRTSVQRKIAESIPVPADEVLLFHYSFIGRGAVDLVPGMELEVEKSFIRPHGSRRELQSSQADYAVQPYALEGVSLIRTHAQNVSLAGEASEIFHLDKAVSGATHLRLYLQTANGTEVQRKSLLLTSSSVTDLDRVTTAMGDEAAGGCSATTTPGVRCISFDAAVSLLIACRINGKPASKPLGTTLEQLIGELPSAIQTARVLRQRSDGTFVSIDFPHTRDGELHVVLVDGDRIDWK